MFCTKEEDGKKDANNKGHGLCLVEIQCVQWKLPLDTSFHWIQATPNNQNIPSITNILRVRELGWFHSKINEVGRCNGSSQNKKLVQW